MKVDNIFAQHTPTPAQKRRINSLRNFARMLAREIQSSTPAGPNQTLAIQHVEDALMRANKAILADAGHGRAIVDCLLRPGGLGKLRFPRRRAVSRRAGRHLHPCG
jgi:hypothetical protein